MKLLRGRLLVVLFVAFQLELTERFEDSLIERVEQAGGLEVVDSGQVLAGAEPEMRQELLRGPIKQGTPGPSRRPAVRTQPASISTSTVPLEICTPRMASISARLTGS